MSSDNSASFWLASNRLVAITCVTSSSNSRRPRTSIRREAMTVLRYFSIISGQMTRLMTPLSSSSVMKHHALGAAGSLADQHDASHVDPRAVLALAQVRRRDKSTRSQIGAQKCHRVCLQG